MAVFGKNAILTGTLDNFCLVCETHLKSDDDTTSHISKPIHRKNLESSHYVEQYEIDMIRKVKIGYFCEFCNIVFKTLAKATLHVNDSKHIDVKNKNLFGRIGNFIIFNNIAINETSWNGLNDNMCTLCNMEYDNIGLHKSKVSHMLNLLQAKEMFYEDNIYRKFDEASFHCLTCNILVVSNKLNAHFFDSEHKILYQACRDAYDRVKAKNINMKSDSEDVDALNKTNAMELQAKNIEDKSRIESQKKEFEDLAKINDLKIKKELKAYCSRCNIDITSLQSMKEHISSKNHKNQMDKLKVGTKALKKIPDRSYLKNITYVKGNEIFNDVIVNDQFCINLASLSLLSPNTRGGYIRCLCCEVTFDYVEVSGHLQSDTHNKKFNHNVVTEDDSEFIREIGPNIFHCGFCNLVVYSWDIMGFHLTSMDHMANKNQAQEKLQRHLPNMHGNVTIKVCLGQFSSNFLLANMFNQQF